MKIDLFDKIQTFLGEIKSPTTVFGRILVSLIILSLNMPNANAASRVKDIADFEGVRENILVGYGLVVGLNGTGDSSPAPPLPSRA